ncbi:MAG: glutaredoxin family protein [Chloroflexaceae bacterium]|nr:glutaredoxin family protein [Chloroflexaceae bacterium]
MHLILYSKPGCHLCEGLQTKLRQIQGLKIQLEIRDITTREDWLNAYYYEVPVLYCQRNNHIIPIPRPAPRVSVAQLEAHLRKYITQANLSLNPDTSAPNV